MEHAVVPAWAMLAYLVSGVFFILALRGLSSPASSRRGNRFGMAGMLIAVVTTLVTHEVAALPEILGAIAIGGGIGWVIARKIAMTDMPQLVAAFHSLVGLAAVLVGVAAYLNPEAFGILDANGEILTVSRVEMGLGVAIGAITFSGSVIAFLKLAGKSARFVVFDDIVKAIRTTYPEECFELYKKKINGFLESAKKRSGYRQAAYWLKLMGQIPGHPDKFHKYVEQLRTKYSKRSAFKEEIKSI